MEGGERARKKWLRDIYGINQDDEGNQPPDSEDREAARGMGSAGPVLY